MKYIQRSLLILFSMVFLCMICPKTISASEVSTEASSTETSSTETSSTETPSEESTQPDTNTTEEVKDGGMVESLSVSISKKGFRPSKENYLRIKSYINTGYQLSDVRLRIYNKKGKYVFQKKFKNTYGGFLDYKWNGKTSKKNAAGLAAKKYVKNGTYTVEIYVTPKNPNIPKSTKTYKFKVSSKAASGKAGLSAAKTVPIFTGNAKVDYMAEKICKSAGIKSSQSESEKVRLIYHWMTINQKHVHYYEGGNFKTYYKLKSSTKKINKYKKASDKRYKKGKIIYNYDTALAYEQWCMERRIGVCTDHAAIFKILCNHVGIEAGICSGYYLNRNGTKAGHSWNYAIVDGETYYYDVDVEIQNYGKGQGDYYWYQKNRTDAEKTHEFHSEE
ncbi:MAG: hypothetical protein J6A75_09415 [Lachnospiraceae bacterium]|nr:hypothetical protein [Lachnospiraceae bacterium]